MRRTVCLILLVLAIGSVDELQGDAISDTLGGLDGSSWWNTLGSLYDRPVEVFGMGAETIAGATYCLERACDPNPGDGGMLDATWATFSWSPGEFAVLHDFYLGEDSHTVSAATPDDAAIYLGRQTTSRLLVGMAGGLLPQGLSPDTTYYWRVDEINDVNADSPWKGNIWSFYVPPLTAWDPTPADGAQFVDPNQHLSWRPGAGAILHTIYLGESFQAVNNASDGDVMTANLAYDPSPLKPNATYYWRVDELQFPEIETHKGRVWSFTVVDYLVVDDFESYNDDYENYRRIFQTWIDGQGYTNPIDVPGNGSGAYVGHDVWTEGTPHKEIVETEIVRPGGKQSMPLYYHNDRSPFYSVADRTWPTAQNWTVNGLDTLVLHLYGSAANHADPLHVTLEDSAGNITTITHPDPLILQAPRWTEWSIPLSRFAGVDAARIGKMHIGIGHPNHPTPVGSGLLYIDDIRVIRSAVIE